MYADRVEAESKRSIKDRLNGASIGDTRRRQFTGKRFAFSIPSVCFQEKLFPLSPFNNSLHYMVLMV